MLPPQSRFHSPDHCVLKERFSRMAHTFRTSSRRPAARMSEGRIGGWLGIFLLASLLSPGMAHATDALILGRDVNIRQTPQISAKVIKTTHPGETYEVIGRKPGKGQPLYIFDERGDLWVKVQVTEETHGFIRTDLVSVSREEFPSPRGNPLLIVNLRPTADGAIARELWLVQNDWQQTRRLGPIEGKPIWASHGEWFICQVDSERPVKDPNVERTVEQIEKFSADGRTRSTLAIGSYPVLYEARGEVYFYRDVGEQGEAVPFGLFAVNVDGTNLRPVFLLPEKFRFWKEDGDFYVQAPPPILQASTNRISLRAFDRGGTRIRFTVTLDGQLVEQRPD
jgi:hypothetical protein